MNKEDSQILHFKADREGERLDTFLVRKLELSESFKGVLSRSKIQKLIEEGKVTVNGSYQKKNYVLKGDEYVDIEIPPQNPVELVGEHIDFQILYEDNHIIIVNKPAGIITHPTAIKTTGTLVNGLIGKGIKLAPAGGLFRPGIVHRLDKDTSGALILAKTDQAYYELIKIFKQRKIEKYYKAIVIGNLPVIEGFYDKSIGRHPRNRSKMAVLETGRVAKTLFSVSERYIGFDLLSLKILTGRTHQIRVHLANAGHPILGDSVYGGKRVEKIEEYVRSLGQIGVSPKTIKLLLENIKKIMEKHNGMFLHAERLIFNHPITGEKIDQTAFLPESFKKMVNLLSMISLKNI